VKFLIQVLMAPKWLTIFRSMSVAAAASTSFISQPPTHMTRWGAKPGRCQRLRRCRSAPEVSFTMSR